MNVKGVGRLPKLPNAMLRPRYKKPATQDFKADMQALGEEIAEGFKESVVENIRSNKYGHTLAPSTVTRKGHDTPLIDTEEMIDAIFREGTTVSVNDEQHGESGVTNKELAVIHEFGTKDKRIPPRPVWRQTFRDYEQVAKKRIAEFLKTQKLKDNPDGTTN